jgi:uncharacterized membrane protein
MAESNVSRTNGFLSKWNDERVERILGTLLQTGVIISGIVVLIGGVLYAERYGRVPVNYQDFDPERASLRSLKEVGRGALDGDGRAIIQCGLLLLIATPVSRVLFSMIAFALERDRLYVALTLIVFVILLYSLFGGVG